MGQKPPTMPGMYSPNNIRMVNDSLMTNDTPMISIIFVQSILENQEITINPIQIQ